MLLHVVDISHPHADKQIEAVNSVLDEIGAGGKATRMVFNKIDQAPQPETIQRYQGCTRIRLRFRRKQGKASPIFCSNWDQACVLLVSSLSFKFLIVSLK